MQNRYCTLATSSAEGWPWASPLLYLYDRDWTLYWSSAIAAQHSINLQANQGRAFVTIYDSQAAQGSVTGVFLQGAAQEVLDPEQADELLRRTGERLGRPLDRTAADYLQDSPRRFYQFTPQTAWVTGDRVAIGHQLVDTKVVLDLADLRIP